MAKQKADGLLKQINRQTKSRQKVDKKMRVKLGGTERLCKMVKTRDIRQETKKKRQINADIPNPIGQNSTIYNTESC